MKIFLSTSLAMVLAIYLIGFLYSFTMNWGIEKSHLSGLLLTVYGLMFLIPQIIIYCFILHILLFKSKFINYNRIIGLSVGFIFAFLSYSFLQGSMIRWLFISISIQFLFAELLGKVLIKITLHDKNHNSYVR